MKFINTLTKILRSFKTPPHPRIFLAACVWSSTGFCLIFRTTRLLAEQPLSVKISVFTASCIIGIAKAYFALIPMAKKIIKRNYEKKQACIGIFFSKQNWLLIGSMIILGRLLLALPIPTWEKALILATVGCGMLLSSGWFWLAWQKNTNYK